MTNLVPTPPTDPPNTQDGLAKGRSVSHTEELVGADLNFK
ncbi:hypothetical protein Tco_0521213, partial [Tanacetum coccineum]